MKPLFITTAIPYVNGDPHIGHAQELIEYDAIARYYRSIGRDVYQLWGSDENSLKNVQAAEQAGEPVAKYVDERTEDFRSLIDSLNLSTDSFIKTTSEQHKRGSQELWNRTKREDIYKKSYTGLYCVGCEAFYTEEELVDGICPEHKKPLDSIKEENYFFRLSDYQEQLDELISSDTIKITPEFRKNEVLAFIRRGLDDFSISRSESRAHGWGVPVPGDTDQIMYVWYDALSNYITGLGFGSDDNSLYAKYWEQTDTKNRQVIHTIGKGITRFHAIYWPAMLLSAGVPLPTEIFVHEYITVEGEKMSKSIGNVIHPKTIVDKYGVDAVRYYFLGAISPFKDGDFSTKRFEEYYTAHLVNGIGNLTSRVLTMVEKFSDGIIPTVKVTHNLDPFWNQYDEYFETYQFDRAIQHVQSYIAQLDGYINETEPWKKVKEGEDVSEIVYTLAESLRHLALAHLPLIPDTAEKILKQLHATNIRSREWGGLQGGERVTKGDILFDRLS